jgi:hypothetical protein
MKHLKVLAVIPTLALLAGCAGMNGGGNVGQKAIDAAFAQGGVCNMEVVNRPEYAGVRAHFHAGEIPASELTDDRRPTPEEARLVVARWDARAPCRQILLTGLASPPANRPDAAQIWSAFFAEGASLNARFAKGDMTWGQFAQTNQASLTSTRAQLAGADAEFRQQAANRALAAAAILGATMPRPPQTIYVAPCTVYGQIAHVC